MFVSLRHFDGPIRVQFPALAQAADDINITVTTMHNSLEELETSLNTKMVDWEGDARGAYTVAKTNWNNAAGEIERLLGSISRAVVASSERMAAAEMNNAARFGGR